RVSSIGGRREQGMAQRPTLRTESGGNILAGSAAGGRRIPESPFFQSQPRPSQNQPGLARAGGPERHGPERGRPVRDAVIPGGAQRGEVAPDQLARRGAAG